MCRFSWGGKFSAPWGKHRGARLLARMATVRLVLYEITKLSSEGAAPFCVAASDVGRSCGSPFSPALGVGRVPRFGHADWGVVVSPCGFGGC